MPKRYDTVIFDLDGTLLDTLDDLADSTNAALKHFGFPLRSRDEVRQFVGNGVARLIELALPEGKDTVGFDDILSWFKVYYEEHSEVKTRPYDGVQGMLVSLRTQGYKTAVVSNKFHDAVCSLCRMYFKDLIMVSTGENEAAGIRRKPAPDTVWEALDALGSTRDNSVYVGDSEVDADTAENAGIDCVLVSWGFRDRSLLEKVKEQKDMSNVVNVTIVDTPEELVDILIEK